MVISGVSNKHLRPQADVRAKGRVIILRQARLHFRWVYAGARRHEATLRCRGKRQGVGYMCAAWGWQLKFITEELVPDEDKLLPNETCGSSRRREKRTMFLAPCTLSQLNVQSYFAIPRKSILRRRETRDIVKWHYHVGS